jgi:hypothetical protein
MRRVRASSARNRAQRDQTDGGAGRRPRPSCWVRSTQARLGGHVVHFYTRFAGLAAEVGSYLAAGLADGAAVLVIATEAHTRNPREEPATRGVVHAQAGEGEGMILLDAADMLAEITVRERVDRDAFMRVVGGLLRTAGQPGRSVRVMVRWSTCCGVRETSPVRSSSRDCGTS